MPIDPRRTRRDCLRLVAGGSLVTLAGCTGDQSGNGNEDDPSPTATDDDGTPTDERGTGSEDQIVRLSPIEDRGELWHTGLVTVYPTDLIEWLREATRGDHTLRTHVATGQEMPDPPLQVLQDVRLVDDAGDLDGHYDLEVDAGTRYEMQAGAEQVDPPADAAVTPVADLAEQRREFAIAAIDEGSSAASVYPETELGEWVRESFFDGYYRYGGKTYRGHERQGTDAASSATEAWYVLSASPSREGDDDTSLVLPDFEGTVREELDAAGVGDRIEGFSVAEPSEPLVRVADRTAMLVTHLTAFRVRLEAA